MLKSTQCLIACFLLVVGTSGCGDKNADDESSQAQRPEESARTPAPYPMGLSAKSSPSEVAKVLIQALDADDNGTLLGLVAVKQGMADIDAIYRKYGRRSDRKPASVAAMTVAGWQATYAFFKKNETHVEREAIRGDTAEVFATGQTPVGATSTLKITLLREDGLWKVKPGLESLPQ